MVRLRTSIRSACGCGFEFGIAEIPQKIELFALLVGALNLRVEGSIPSRLTSLSLSLFVSINATNDR